MVAAMESDVSRRRLYRVPSEPSTWRVYVAGQALGRVIRVETSYLARSQDGRIEMGGFRSRRSAAAALERIMGVAP